MKAEKKCNLLEMIGCIIIFATTFLPAMYEQSGWNIGVTGWNQFDYSLQLSFIDIAQATHMNKKIIILGCMVYASLIVGFVLALIQLCSKRRRQNIIVMIVAAMVTLMTYLGFSIAILSRRVETTAYIIKYSTSGLFWVDIGLIVILVLVPVSSLVKNNKKKNSPIEDFYVSKSASQESETENLRKYKELLDAEIITQDEFEKKKKQILGL